MPSNTPEVQLSLFNKDETFYDLLEGQAEVAHKAAETFLKLTTDWANLENYVEALDAIESEGDHLCHQLTNRIDSTFVTPLDKEDLHALVNGLDDITDFIEASTARLVIYQLLEPREDLHALVRLLVNITAATVKAVSNLRNLKARGKFQHTIIRIHEIENEADRSFRQALGDLFNAPDAEPINVIKWKEIYDRIERAMDSCEDVANMVESVVVKYA
jgi:predicted phosphate transport protein (TIGR00153 family)